MDVSLYLESIKKHFKKQNKVKLSNLLKLIYGLIAIPIKISQILNCTHLRYTI